MSGTAKISTSVGMCEVDIDEVFEIEGRTYFTHYDSCDGWQVSEWESGRLAASFYDDMSHAEDVIAFARERIAKAGPEVTARAIARSIAATGIANPPREATHA